jgi:FlaA1/EpsC-like NDP-sugar epimerase
MNTVRCFLKIYIAALMFSFAFAQDIALSPAIDLVAIGASLVVASILVQHITESLKQTLERFMKVNARTIQATALVVSFIVSFVLAMSNSLSSPEVAMLPFPFNAIIFAFLIWRTSMGRYDSESKKNPPQITNVDIRSLQAEAEELSRQRDELEKIPKVDEIPPR